MTVKTLTNSIMASNKPNGLTNVKDQKSDSLNWKFETSILNILKTKKNNPEKKYKPNGKINNIATNVAEKSPTNGSP